MRVRAQVAMVMNLDKCIGCHTCSVTCKQVWTNRPGTEYVWFNNVETSPGLGYPRTWADQARWRGGWELDGKGRLRLRAGGRVKKLLTIFSNPDLPAIDDYYEPWTYDYETLVDAPLSDRDPVARSHSQLTGKPMDVRWGPNWDEGLAGGPEIAVRDPHLHDIQEQVRMTYEQAFMFFLRDAARRSPIYDLAIRWGVALPLHPDFRTLPMVWYVPPLSPVAATLETDDYEADPDDVFGAIDHLRIPIEYLANLLTAGDTEAIRGVLHRLAAMRSYMHKREVLGETDDALPPFVGLTGPELERMYRLLAIANYEDRYVIPQAHAEVGERLMQQQGGCGPDFEDGPGNCGAIDPRPASSSPTVENFHLVDILRRNERGRA